MVSSLPGQANIQYGAGFNGDLIAFMGVLNGTVLDVGCGAGTWGPSLRALGAARLLGLEPTSSANQARDRFDDVVECAVEDVDAAFVRDTDALIFADVLEHLLDPWQVLSDFRGHVKVGTDLYISLPNAQNFRIGVPLLMRGRFDYSDAGARWTAGIYVGSLAPHYAQPSPRLDGVSSASRGVFWAGSRDRPCASPAGQRGLWSTTSCCFTPALRSSSTGTRPSIGRRQHD